MRLYLKLFFLLIFFYVFCNFSYSQNDEYLDSLTNIVKKPKYDLQTASAYVGLSEILYVANIDTVLYLCNNAIKIIDVVFNSENPLDSNLKSEYKRIKASALNNIGYVYDNRGDISKAIEYYFNALKIREEINDKTGIAESYNNLGAIYKNQGNFDKALDYYTKCYSLWTTEGYDRGVSQILSNIGVIYDQLGDWNKALEYYNKSLKIIEQIGDKKGMADLLNNIGIIYSNFDSTDVALKYYFNSLKIRNEIEDKEGTAISLYTIAKIEYDEKRYSRALDFALKSLKISSEIGFPARVMSASELLNKIYIKLENWKDAYKMYNMYINMRDSISNEEIRKDALKKQLQNEYEKKEAEVKAEQEKKALIAAEQNRRQKLYLLFFALIAIAVAIIAILIYRSLRVTRKQKTEIEIQKVEVENQKHIVEEKQKEILDSISYAKYLQTAILPPEKHLANFFNDFFIYYKPKDIVAGDFYWFEVAKNNKCYFAVADCTGHGVPGALVSVVCSNALNRAVKEFNLSKPSVILDKVRELVIETFQKSEKDIKDGMDISLVAIELQVPSYELQDTENENINTLTPKHSTNIYKAQWAGANNPLYVVSNYELQVSSLESETSTPQHLNTLAHQLYEIKGDKMPIAIYERMDEFTNHELELHEGDVIYLFTDGFADQFGGENGKKFMYKNFKEMLLSNSGKSMQEQQKIYEEKLQNWIGNGEQIDDITIFGLRI